MLPTTAGHRNASPPLLLLPTPAHRQRKRGAGIRGPASNTRLSMASRLFLFLDLLVIFFLNVENALVSGIKTFFLCEIILACVILA